MKRLLLTSALIAPFLIGPALAQDTAPADPPVVGQPETVPETDTGLDQTTDAPTDPAPDAGSALDQPESTDDAAAPEAAMDTQPAGDTIVREQEMNELRVDWITGTTVRSMQDESIGSIRDLIIDQETNTITAAILSVGGFLGIGAKQIAVRFDELEIDFDAREIHLNLTREQADDAPEFAFRERTDAPPPPVSNGTGTPLQPLD